MLGTIARIAVVGVASIAAAIAVADGKADGLPVLGVDVGPVGVVATSGPARYVTLPAKGHTVVARVRRDGGQILASRVLPGSFTIPAVAYDGSASGLSADGHVLVLIQPRAQFPRVRTTLAILDARLLRVRTILQLRGDFSFDAISPDASLLYFIEYVAPRDPTRYAVRAYDVASGRFLGKPIVDPNEEDPGEMRGYPLTRTVSPDGRWAYTLYDGAGKHPFIHALDTSEGRAVCIDTPSLAGRRDLDQLGLGVSGDGSALTVAHGTQPVALVNTQTFEVTDPSEPAPRADPGNSDAWRLIAPAAVVLLLSGGALFLILRRRGGDLAAGDA